MPELEQVTVAEAFDADGEDSFVAASSIQTADETAL